MNRAASAVWTGNGRTGTGSLTTDSGVLHATPYSLKTRIGDDPGTGPEELLAAAHAGCFNMALAVRLEDAGYRPERLETTARLTMTVGTNAIDISRVALQLDAVVPGIERSRFFELASEASRNCTISSVLKARVDLNVSLLS